MPSNILKIKANAVKSPLVGILSNNLKEKTLLNNRARQFGSQFDVDADADV